MQIEDRREEPEFGGAAFGVKVRVDVRKRLGRLEPVWRFFGADEPNYAYMEHGRKLLGELGALAAQGGQSDREPRSPLPNPPRRGEGTGGDGAQGVYFRAHNLLTSGDGTPALKWGSTGVCCLSHSARASVPC